MATKSEQAVYEQAVSQPPRSRASRSLTPRNPAPPNPAPQAPAPRKRDFTEERGDYTIALLLISVLLLVVASVAYAWPKASSTRLAVEYLGEEALEAGAIFAARERLPGEEWDESANCGDAPHNESPDASNPKCRVMHGVYNFLLGSRINHVNLKIEGVPSCRPYQGEHYIRASFRWEFLNPRSVVDVPGDVTSSIQHAYLYNDYGLCN